MGLIEFLLRPVCIVLAYLVASSIAQAAELTVDPSRGAAGAVLEGKIEKGDFANLQNFLLNNGAVREIYLGSPGGDLAEAIKLGLLVRSLELSTIVPSKSWTNQDRQAAIARHALKDGKADYMCASACFFVFIGGIYRGRDLPGPPLLGIHRPRLSPDDLKRLTFEEVNMATDQTKTVVEKYLRFMGVPETYAEAMFAVPNRRIHWISGEDFDRDFTGFIPVLRQWVAAECDKRAGSDKKIPEQLNRKTGSDDTAPQAAMDQTLKGKNEERLECERKVQERLASNAHDKMLMRNSNLPPLDGLLVSPLR